MMCDTYKNLISNQAAYQQRRLCSFSLSSLTQTNHHFHSPEWMLYHSEASATLLNIRFKICASNSAQQSEEAECRERHERPVLAAPAAIEKARAFVVAAERSVEKRHIRAPHEEHCVELRGRQQSGAREQCETLVACRAADTERSGQEAREHCRRLQVKRVARRERQERAERVQSDCVVRVAAGATGRLRRRCHTPVSACAVELLASPSSTGWRRAGAQSETRPRGLPDEVDETHAARTEATEAGGRELRDAEQ